MSRYDQEAVDHWRARAADAAHQKVYDKVAEQVTGPGPVLDLACGPGYVLERLAKREYVAVGFDSSPESVAFGQKRLTDAGIDVCVVAPEELDLSERLAGKVQLVEAGFHDLSNLPRGAFKYVVSTFIVSGVSFEEEAYNDASAIEVIPDIAFAHKFPSRLVAIAEQVLVYGRELEIDRDVTTGRVTNMRATKRPHGVSFSLDGTESSSPLMSYVRNIFGSHDAYNIVRAADRDAVPRSFWRAGYNLLEANGVYVTTLYVDRSNPLLSVERRTFGDPNGNKPHRVLGTEFVGVEIALGDETLLQSAEQFVTCDVLVLRAKKKKPIFGQRR